MPFLWHLVALGNLGASICKEVSLIVVVTIKKNNNMNTISGNDAVFTAGIPFFFFLNLDILYVFNDVKR